MNVRFSFTKIDNAVIDDKFLSRSAKAIFTILAKHSKINSRGERQCFLLINTIASESSYSSRTVQYALKTLEDKGIIVRTYRYNSSTKAQRANLYTIIGAAASRYDITDIHTDFDAFPIDATEQLEALTAPITIEAHDCSQTESESVTCDDFCTPRCNSCTHNKTVLNIMDSLTRVSQPQHESLTQYTKALLTNDCDAMLNLKRTESSQRKYSLSISEIPQALQDTAKYFLEKTGRASFSEDEISAARALNAKHTPARIIKEIDAKIASFTRRNLPLDTLTFCYIASAMKNQRPTLKRKKKDIRGLPDFDKDTQPITLSPEQEAELLAGINAMREFLED